MARTILMADIVGSRSVDQSGLMRDFKEVTNAAVKKNKKGFLSPLTITLGDEFQCITKGLCDSVSLILEIEEQTIRKQKDFRLRYVSLEGEIDTPINHKIAHGMMGPGLTAAREKLGELKKQNAERFCFVLKDQALAQNINLAFVIYQSILEEWDFKRDYPVVSQFLDTDDYKVVAENLGKDRSLAWKRERSLKIKEYKAIKALIRNMAGNAR